MLRTCWGAVFVAGSDALCARVREWMRLLRITPPVIPRQNRGVNEAVVQKWRGVIDTAELEIKKKAHEVKWLRTRLRAAEWEAMKQVRHLFRVSLLGLPTPDVYEMTGFWP